MRAGLVESPEEYYWSSYRDYIGFRKRWVWLETEWILKQFGSTGRKGHQGYRQFVQEGLRRDMAYPLKQGIAGIDLESESFVNRLQEELLERNEDTLSRETLKVCQKMSVEQFIDSVSELMRVSKESIRQRGRHGNEMREVTIYLAWKYCKKTNITIGKEFGEIWGTHVSYVSYKVKERLNYDQTFRQIIEEIEKNLFFEV